MHMYACLPACLPACAFQTLVLESPVALFPFLSFPFLPFPAYSPPVYMEAEPDSHMSLRTYTTSLSTIIHTYLLHICIHLPGRESDFRPSGPYGRWASRMQKGQASPNLILLCGTAGRVV